LALTQPTADITKKKGQVRYCTHPVQLISDTVLNLLNTPTALFSGLKCTYSSMIYRLRFTQLSTTEALYLHSAVAL